MEIIRIPLYQSNVPVPDAGKRDPNEPPLKYGLENIQHTVSLAKIPDPENIQLIEGTGLAALGIQSSLTLNTVLNVNPISWLNTGTNKLKFRVRAQLTGLFNGDGISSLLAQYNCVVINTNINGTPYGGFLVLTIGTKGSGADLILSDLNLRNGKFIATVNRMSGEF